MKLPIKIEHASEEILLRRSMNGDSDAFLALYRRLQGSVFRFALHMSGSRDIAEEVVQEVFLSLVESPAQYDAGRGPLEAYLIGAARNQVRRHLRHHARTAPESSAPAATTNLAHVDPDLFRLRTAILALPPNYREVVVLCDLEELSYEQAAARLGTPIGTIRSRLSRARAILLARMRRTAAERCPV